MFKVKFETSKGDFVVEVHKDWAPIGAERFHELVSAGFYDGCRFFRVVEGFVTQFGINGDPAVSAQWVENTIRDDPVTQSNKRGTVTFATSGANSRTTQLFINFNDRNSALDSQGFSPFGEVVEGMDVVDSFYGGYADRPTEQQGQIQQRGNAFLDEKYPKLDYIKTATIVE